MNRYPPPSFNIYQGMPKPVLFILPLSLPHTTYVHIWGSGLF